MKFLAFILTCLSLSAMADEGKGCLNLRPAQSYVETLHCFQDERMQVHAYLDRYELTVLKISQPVFHGKDVELTKDGHEAFKLLASDPAWILKVANKNGECSYRIHMRQKDADYLALKVSGLIQDVKSYLSGHDFNDLVIKELNKELVKLKQIEGRLNLVNDFNQELLENHK